MAEIYQLRITAVGIEPEVYRILEVSSNIGLRKLNLFIQELFGFNGYHLYGFRHDIDDDWLGDIHPNDHSGQVRLKTYLNSKTQITYKYDFGDNWEFCIKLEQSMLKDDKVSYPRCIGGVGNYLIEDCGGAYRYNIIANWCRLKNKQNYDLMVKFFGKEEAWSIKAACLDYNPDHFDYRDVVLGKLRYYPPADG